MLEHDDDVGKLLKTLDDLGIADNTIVLYTTDNGPNQFSWPDAATTPFVQPASRRVLMPVSAAAASDFYSSTMTACWWRCLSITARSCSANSVSREGSRYGDPFTCLRLPKVFNLRMDPFERADIVSDQYNDWLVKNVYLTAIATMKASEFLQSFVI